MTDNTWRDASDHNERGIALARAGRHAESAAEFEKAIALSPRLAEAHANLGNALSALGRHDAARDAFRTALAIAPNLAPVWASLGASLRTLGRIDESRAALERAVALAPDRPRLYFELSQSKTFADAADPHLAAMQSLARETDRLDSNERIHLHFALGSALADLGLHGQAFEHFAAGNSLKRAQITYDERATFGLLEKVEAIFNTDFMRQRAAFGDPSAAPVFVFGMPRSGSTLVEQILAGHPAVAAVGECMQFRQAVGSIAGRHGYPDSMPALPHDAFAAMGRNYVEHLRALAPHAERISDKSLGNFLFAGLIHLALPNARFVHTRRDARDTCLSCFTKLFPAEYRFSYDLAELGRYYRAYERLMAHWRRVLPPGIMLEVRYEELVADVETQARRIVAHCGLPWDDACLAFHTVDRPVLTFSAAQVRQPIYTGAVERWRAYATQLQPLIDALGE